ncbi:restriction endonuclease subunit S [Streptomyces sp. ME03-5684b]|uniref:restriction endonuclease subunit S n=1 Tax=Streptomyces TaxID=1883 RepID=UPI0029A17E0A|nr:restriction endonuclease subunit S [Streptomyces sp. ME03-5684b]MDX3315846.1 restriction endonuclease subunit S [Streptomyces sp. ME03-5684b]
MTESRLAPWLSASQWPTAPIRLVARLGSGHTPSRSKPEYWENCTVPWITLADVWQLRAGRTNFITETKEMISPLGLANSAAVEHPAGTVILSRTASVGFSAIMGRDMATSQDFATWTCGPKLEPRYLLHALRGMAPDLKRVATGSTHKTIYMPDIEQLRVPVPPLGEQRRIIDFLDAETARIDALAAMRECQVSLLEERLMSTWSKVIDEDARDSNWAPIRRFLTGITDGPFGSALTSSHYSDEGARVIRLGNLGRAEFRNHDHAYIPLEYFAQLQRHEARPGDLIVAGLGDQNHPLGRASVVPDGIGPAIVKADCFRLRLDQRKVLHEYAAWALSSQRVTDQVAMLARGSTRARINLEVARDIPIPVPSLDRQRRSIELLRGMRSSTHTVATQCRRQLALLTERRQALITAAVTGQFDVSTASGRNVTEGVSV